MKIIDIDRVFVRQFYNGNVKKAIEAHDGVIFTEANIIKAFCGSTIEEAKRRLARFIRDNKCYAYYYDYDKQCFL